MKLNAPSMPVDELIAMLPAMGVVLPSGSQLKGGTLSANLGITGPLDKLVITGPVRLSDTKLMGFDLGSKMGALSVFAGKAVSNPDTSVQNVSLDTRVAPEGTQANDVNVTVPAIGVITGAGTISPAGALNFKMLANLHGGVVGGLSQVAATGSGKGGIPFAIGGTTSNPQFTPDMAGMVEGVGGMASGALQGAVSGKVPVVKNVPTDALGGLLGKKKKQWYDSYRELIVISLGKAHTTAPRLLPTLPSTRQQRHHRYQQTADCEPNDPHEIVVAPEVTTKAAAI